MLWAELSARGQGRHVITYMRIVTTGSWAANATPSCSPVDRRLEHGALMNDSTDKFIDESAIRKMFLVGGGVTRNVSLKGAF